MSCVVEAAALTPPSKRPILSKMAAVKRSLLVLTCLLALRASSAITYVPKCYCPGKDPYLARDANLKNKMYQLKSEYTTNQLKINYRPVLAKPGVPPVMVLSKMFPEVTKREQEELTLHQYIQLVDAKAAAVDDR